MHFITDAKVFSDELAEALKFSSESGTPCQKSVLLTLKENTLEFRTRTHETAPYRESAFCSTITVDGIEDGQIALPSKLLASIVATYEKGEVEFKSDEKNLKINQKGNNFKVKLVDLDPKDMDFEVPKADDFSPLSEDFCNAITKVAYATNKKDTREICRAVFFEYTDEKFHVVSTDGKRISSMSLHEKGKGKTLLPVEFASMMGKAKAEGIFTEENRVVFKKGNRYYVSSYYTAEYPNWKKIMPPKTDCERAEVNRQDLADAVKRMSITADPDSHKIRIKVDGDKMTVSSFTKNKELEGEEIISCISETPFEKYFKFNFIADILKASTSKTLTLHYGKADNRPIMITDEDPCFKAAVCDMKGDAV
jgi:DNA polymerase III subunit beta